MIEIVTDEKLKEHGINMFGEILNEHTSQIYFMECFAAYFVEPVIVELCGKMGRVIK